MPFLAFTDADRWVPGIGDPTFMGWLTVAAYFAAFVCCVRVLFILKKNSNRPREEILFWTALAIFTFFLGINKQLDLQTWFTLTAKKLARSEGWYEQRRYFQMAFILLVALGGAGGVLLARWWTRKSLKHTSLALTGAIFLTCFVIVRAASFHHVDQMLGFAPGGLKINWILELTGIGLLTAGAWKAAKYLRQSRSQSMGFIWVTANDRL